MIKIEARTSKLFKQLDRIKYHLNETLVQIISRVMRNTADYIILVAPEDTGRLKSSIKVELIDVEYQQAIGRVYADIDIAPYALWVNYGTGIYAEGEGGSRAKKIPWFVHSSMANLDRYGYPTWTAPDGNMFYIVEGMHATHFFDSAPEHVKQKNIDAVCEEIRNMLKEANV